MTSRPSKLICIGLNYRKHAEEANLPMPEQPIAFAKWTSSIIGNGDTIRLPAFSQQIDFEAELAVIIGRTAVDVDPESALDHVAGYACFNDVSARDIQAAENQWSRSKSFDTFGPLGPITSADKIPDPQKLGIRCLINGDLMQDGNTSDMVFSVAEIISFLSQGTTLHAGDVIATGTPAGIGLTRKPPRFLQKGDVVSIEIDGIETLSNPVA